MNRRLLLPTRVNFESYSFSQRVFFGIEQITESIGRPFMSSSANRCVFLRGGAGCTHVGHCSRSEAQYGRGPEPASILLCRYCTGAFGFPLVLSNCTNGFCLCGVNPTDVCAVFQKATPPAALPKARGAPTLAERAELERPAPTPCACLYKTVRLADIFATCRRSANDAVCRNLSLKVREISQSVGF